MISERIIIDYSIIFADDINKFLDNFVILHQFCAIVSDHIPKFNAYSNMLVQ